MATSLVHASSVLEAPSAQNNFPASDDTPGWDAPRGMNDPAPVRARPRRSHDARPAEAERRSVIPPSINKIQIKWLHGSKVELHCSQLRNGSYQWKVSSGTQRYAKTGQTSRAMVLRRWHDDYVNLLDPASAENLLATVRLLEGEHGSPPLDHTTEQTEEARQEDTIELTEAPLWRLPSLEDIEAFPSFDDLQGHMVASQKLLPKSLTHTLANTVNWLLTTAEDEHQPVEVRAWSMRIVLLAPRILWPAPTREGPNAKLKPNARPHVVKQRLVLLHSGRWGDLLAEAMVSNVSSRSTMTSHNPGTITSQAAKALVTSAREGRIGPAWKQLWSHGIAPNTAETAAAVQRKWAPAPSTALPSITPLPPTEIAEAVTAQKQWLQATRKLKKGTAADAAGWTTEAFAALNTFPATSGHLRHLVKKQMLGLLREDELRCMGAIHILALNKNNKGEIRPISIPSIWRKLLSSPRQHGIGMPSGISRFAKKVADLAVARPELLFLQTDISNAFGMVHRESVQQALLQCDESLAACSRAWLSREATGFVQVPGQQRQRITSARGLQQGDPLSALAFSIVMESALRDLEATLRR
eukprot:6472043-Amphidinium_carterae.1